MRRISTLRAGVLAALLVAGAATTSAVADQEFWWSHTWTYVSGPIFDDFHATYAGTGGTIDRVLLTVDDAGGGVIAGNQNMIDITWPDVWVIPGDTFTYTFNTAFSPIEFVGGTITKGGDVIGTIDVDGVVRAPTGAPIGQFEHSFIPAPGSLALLMVAAVAMRRRRAA